MMDCDIVDIKLIFSSEKSHEPLISQISIFDLRNGFVDNDWVLMNLCLE